ncbi:hypothetical protein EV361DRAFT_682673 [Lentinula raphanica]|uniref:Uncharacterized protein n=1 Tax=Lentinula raphanica TaxID=153919 RepID=A0AA38U9P6_9AGAR|nr:hypothetical protein F5880DRAFT_1505282 [Lentinula raphanica]KAJ3831377.1 hypothetical protein F5878DRAFT_667619 [Lentinula raphanica]KAJ3965060.1 hypothetical protein EV361DRAFT_682673 [Lentinula raphanica]
MFSLASTKLSSASCVRLLLTVSFLLWSLGTARAAERSVGSLNPEISRQPTMLHYSQIALHVPPSLHRHTLNNGISMNVGRFLLDNARELKSEGASKEATDLAGSPGDGSKEIGWVWTADEAITKGHLDAALQAVKHKDFPSTLGFLKAYLDELVKRIPHDSDILHNWTLAMGALQRFIADASVPQRQ